MTADVVVPIPFYDKGIALCLDVIVRFVSLTQKDYYLALQNSGCKSWKPKPENKMFDIRFPFNKTHFLMEVKLEILEITDWVGGWCSQTFKLGDICLNNES